MSKRGCCHLSVTWVFGKARQANIVILNSIQNLSDEPQPFIYAAIRLLDWTLAHAHPREILNLVQNDNAKANFIPVMSTEPIPFDCALRHAQDVLRAGKFRMTMTAQRSIYQQVLSIRQPGARLARGVPLRNWHCLSRPVWAAHLATGFSGGAGLPAAGRLPELRWR